MSLDKSGLITALTSIFDDVEPGTTASQKATQIADALDDYVKTAIAQVTIPTGTVITTVTGGSGAPAVGVPNVAPIGLTGDPNGTPDNAGGLS